MYCYVQCNHFIITRLKVQFVADLATSKRIIFTLQTKRGQWTSRKFVCPCITCMGNAFQYDAPPPDLNSEHMADFFFFYRYDRVNKKWKMWMLCKKKNTCQSWCVGLHYSEQVYQFKGAYSSIKQRGADELKGGIRCDSSNVTSFQFDGNHLSVFQLL